HELHRAKTQLMLEGDIVERAEDIVHAGACPQLAQRRGDRFRRPKDTKIALKTLEGEVLRAAIFSRQGRLEVRRFFMDELHEWLLDLVASGRIRLADIHKPIWRDRRGN